MNVIFFRLTALIHWCMAITLSLLVGSAVKGQQPSVTSDQLPSVPLGSVSDALASFEVAEGFRIEAVASEPLVVDPVAMSFDEYGRLYVVEMRDYSERRPERLGRVRVLEDRSGDGVLDYSSVLLDGLAWPTAVICYDGGVFVGSTPDIVYAKDEDGDGKADLVRTVFSGFASDYAPYETNRLNVQALLNSFRWGIDNRIHGATSGSGGKVSSVQNPEAGVIDLRGRDFSFDPRKLDLRPESGGAQHGMSFDDFGQKFVCSNSDHIQQVVYPYRYMGLNPDLVPKHPRVSIADDGAAAPVYRLSPDEPWRVIRTKWRVAGSVGGPVEGGGRPSGYFTGATGVTIYRGDQWPDSHLGNAIIADCGSNLIHRKRVIAEGVINVARRYDEDHASELVASRDNWFRPVQFANAPDGSLWVADMSREVIEHPWSLPENIKRHLDLNHGNGAGRLYRIVAKNRMLPLNRLLGGQSLARLVATLEHPNGWHRDTAARLLLERADLAVKAPLVSLLNESDRAVTRVHALQLLSSLGILEVKHIRVGLSDISPEVRVHSLRLLETLSASQAMPLEDQVSGLVSDADERVRYQLALSLGLLHFPNRFENLYRLSKRAHATAWLRHACLNSIGTSMNEFWPLVLEDHDYWRRPELRDEWLELCRLASRRLEGHELRAALERVVGDADAEFMMQSAVALIEGAGDARAWLPQIQVVLKPLIDRARSLARDERHSAKTVALSVEFLSVVHDPQVEGLLKLVMEREVSSGFITRCLRVCRRLDSPSMLVWLEAGFPRFLPEPRRVFLDLFFDQSPDLGRALDWLEDGRLAYRELSDGQRQALLRHADGGVRDRAARLLTRPKISDDEAMTRLLPALLSEANVSNGRRLFVERCALCHQLDSLGVDVGPQVPSMRGLRKRGMLEAILFPNREVAPQYFGVTVLGDELSQTGMIRSETELSVTLRQAGGNDVTIQKSQVTAIRAGGLSLMPEGLLDGLRVREVADLLEFLMYGEGKP